MMMDGTCWGPTRHAQAYGPDIDVTLIQNPDDPYTFSDWLTDSYNVQVTDVEG